MENKDFNAVSDLIEGLIITELNTNTRETKDLAKKNLTESIKNLINSVINEINLNHNENAKLITKTLTEEKYEKIESEERIKANNEVKTSDIENIDKRLTSLQNQVNELTTAAPSIKQNDDESVEVKVFRVISDNDPSKTYSNAILPEKAHESDSCFDAYSCLDDKSVEEGKTDIIVYPNSSQRIPLGICLNIPEGYEIQCRPRSGMSSKSHIVILGTIDEGYKGMVQAVVYNGSSDTYKIYHGDKICQLAVVKRDNAKFVWGNRDENVGTSDRGTNGFGSSGK